ncbi:acyl-CoA thioesterase [Corynebacterium terpenotabidum]|uniref:acyl-CoA thioesterase n=1 Tax=Corynebacterium terpenotabidum TaxID=89154 RepID=UPI0005A0F7F1|nr:acyl-CoA thioesterase [Corynebacterium terpenotabidum]
MNLYLRLLITWIRGRTLSRLGPWDTHIKPMRVLPTDLDLFGHMNNGRYPTVLDLGRIEHMFRTPVHKEIDRHGGYFVVAALTVNYRRSLLPWQRYDIRTRFLGATAFGTFVEQTFVGVGEHEGVVYAHAMVQLRGLKKSGGTMTDGELYEIFGPVPDGRGVPEWAQQWSDASRQAAKQAG